MRIVFLLMVFCLAGQGFAASTEGQVVEGKSVVGVEKKTIPYKENKIITASLIFRIFLITAILLLFAFGVIYLIKRFYYGEVAVSSGQTINVVEVKRITPKTLIYTVSVLDKTYVLAQSADNIVKLDEISNDKTLKE